MYASDVHEGGFSFEEGLSNAIYICTDAVFNY